MMAMPAHRNAVGATRTQEKPHYGVPALAAMTVRKATLLRGEIVTPYDLFDMRRQSGATAYGK